MKVWKKMPQWTEKDFVVLFEQITDLCLVLEQSND